MMNFTFSRSNIVKTCTLLLLCLFSVASLNAQCTGGTSYSSITVPTTAGVTNTITTFEYMGEYNAGTFAANTYYQSANSTSGCYITVCYGASNGPVVGWGPSPLTWLSNVAGTYYVHYNLNSSCGTNSTNSTSTIKNVGPGPTIPTLTLTPQNNANNRIDVAFPASNETALYRSTSNTMPFTPIMGKYAPAETTSPSLSGFTIPANTDFMLEFWVKQSVPTSAEGWEIGLNTINSGTMDFDRLNSTTIRWIDYTGTTTSGSYTTPTLAANVYEHIRIVRRGTTYKEYYNDILTAVYSRVPTAGTAPAITSVQFANAASGTTTWKEIKIVALNNTSPYQDVAAVDVNVPTTPGSFAVTPTSGSATSLDLSWSAASDNGTTYNYYGDAILGTAGTNEGQESNKLNFTNTSFEKNLLGPWSTWTGSGNPTYTLTSGERFNDLYSVNITASVAGSVGVVYGDQMNSFTNGQQYLVSMWAKSTAGTSSTFSAYCHDVTNATTLGSCTASTPPSGNWQQYSFVATANATTHMRVHLVYNSGTGTLYVDNVQIRPLYSATVTTGVKDYTIAQTLGSPTGTGVGTGTTTTTKTITGLSANTQYCFTVAARDNANNTGTATAQVCRYTRASPVALTATASATCGAVDLSWPSGAWSTVRLRNTTTGTDIYTGSGTSFQETGLTQGATYNYALYVRNGEGLEESVPTTASATVNSCGLPTISSISPTSACYGSGATITINGTNLGGGTVTVNGVAAGVTLNSSSQLQVTLPGTASGTGNIQVTVGVNSVTSSQTFTVNPLATPGSFQYANGSTQTICAGSTISCANTVSPTNGGAGNLGVVWYCGVLTAGSPGAGGSYGNWRESTLGNSSGTTSSSYLNAAAGGGGGMSTSLSNYNPQNDFAGSLNFLIIRRAYTDLCGIGVGGTYLDQYFYLNLLPLPTGGNIPTVDFCAVTGSSTVTVTGVSNATQYNWSLGSLSAVSPSTTNSIVAAGSSIGSYTVSVIPQNVSGSVTCNAAAAVSGTVNINATPGDATTPGNGSWIGYVYNSATAGAFTTYQGYVTEAETFNRNHTSASGASVNHCSSNQDLFAIRYKMNKTFAAGYYTFTVGGDDGVRLSVNGGGSWLIDQWQDQGYTTFTSGQVYLSGTVNLVLEYYENGGGAQTSFTYTCATPAAPSAISGSASVCATNTGLVYSVTNTPNLTYNWTLPSGWTQTAGGNSNSITVTAGASAVSGNISVTASNPCGATSSGTTLAVTVSAAPPTTTGATVCTGGSGTIAMTTVCSTVAQTPQTASGSGGTSDGAYGNGTNISINFPSLPSGAVVTSTVVTISFTANSPSYRSEMLVEATPPAAVGAQQTNLQPSALASYGSVSNAILGTWGTGNPAGTWLFRFGESYDDGVVPDANITNVTITVNYSLPGYQWYTAASGGTLIGTTSPFNPVGAAGSGLANTNTPGTFTYYAACSSNTGCRTATNFVINSSFGVYNVTGGGSYCSGGSGVTVGLSSSDIGVNYQLYNGATPVGSVVAGTGSGISFGLQTAAGTYTVKASNGSCSNVSMSGSAVVSITAVPAQPSAITGATAPDLGSSQTYSVTNVAGVTYTWAFPATWTITAGQGTNSVTVTVGTTNGSISVTPSNSCGNGTAQTLATAIPQYRAKFISVNNGGNWCTGTSRTVTVTIMNNGVTTWTDAGPDINVGLKWSGWGDYYVRTDANSLAPGATQTYSLTIAAKNATTYGPTYSTNLTTGSNTLVFDIVYEGCFWFAGNAPGGSCPGVTVSGNSTYSSAVTITDVPAQPSTISGSTSVCSGTSLTYSVTNVAGVTYNWGFPAGWTQTGGGTSNSVTVTAGTTGGTITVTPSNGCGNGTARTLSVSATASPTNTTCSTATQLPCGTSALAGTTSCTSGAAHGLPGYSVSNYGVWYTFAGDGNTTTITSTANFDHEMDIVSGSCGSFTAVAAADGYGSGGTETITFATTAGTTYYVYIAYYASGGSTTGTFTINRCCATITGPTAICSGATGNSFSIPAMSGSTYSWTVPSGWTITSGTNTSAITANAGSNTGIVSVTVSNYCGVSSSVASLMVTTNPLPTVNAGTDVEICQGGSTPLLANATVPATTLFSENFEQYLDNYYVVNGSWRQYDIVTGYSDWIYSSSGAITGARSLTLYDGNWGYYNSYDYYNTNENVTYFATKINATNYTNLNLNFKWKCAGEAGWDYAKVVWSTNGTTWNDVSPTQYQGQTGVQTVSNLDLSAANGQQFYIGFRWKNDDNTGADPAFTVDDITITGTTTQAITYSWSPTGTLSAANIANPVATPAGTTTYTVTAASTGCTASDDVKVTVRPIPAATISGTTTVCQNDAAPAITFSNNTSLPITVTYTINGGSNQTINLAASGNAVVSAPTAAAGTFIYNLVSAAFQNSPDCSNNLSGSATVTVRPAAAATISGTTTVCLNSAAQTITFANSTALPITVTYNVNSGTNQTINIAGSSTATVSQVATTAGTFTYNLVSAVFQSAPTCVNTLSGSATVTVRPAAVATISGTTTVCQNDAAPSVTFSNSTALPITVTYNVNSGSNQTINIAGSSTATVSAPTGTAGSFAYNLVSAVFQSAPTCVNTLSGSATVTVRPTPSATISGTTTVCQYDASQTITFANPMSLPVTVTYNVNSGSNQTINVAANSTATVSQATTTDGTFTYNLVSVVYQSGPTCSAAASGSATVTVRPKLDATVSGNATVCQGAAAPNVTFTNPQALPITITYTVNGGSNQTINVPANSSATVAVSTATAGTYVYHVVSGSYQTAPNCPNSIGGTVTVVVQAPVILTATATPNPVCYDATLVLNATVTQGTGITSWSWTGPGGFTASTQNTSRSNMLPDASHEGVYYVSATNICGASTPQLTAAVTVNPELTANVVIDECVSVGPDNYYMLVTAAGGVPGYTFTSPKFLAGSDKAVYEVAAGNTDFFTITDASNCTITTSGTAPTGHPTDIVFSNTTGTKSVDCYDVNMNNWLTFRDDATNEAILSINDNGKNLGQVTVTVYKEAVEPATYTTGNNCLDFTDFKAMQRHFMVTTANAPNGPVGVRLYFTQDEANALHTASIGNNVPGNSCTENDDFNDVTGLTDLYVTKYTGADEDDDYTNNHANGLYRVFGTANGLNTPDGPLTKGAAQFGSLFNGAQSHHYVELTVTEFSEFWMSGSYHASALPVEMIYLEANAIDNSYIQLTWATAIEINNKGFQVERSLDGQTWSTIGWVDGHDNSTVQQNYSYNDMDVTGNVRYYYRLKQIDFDGAFEYTDLVSAIITQQSTFSVKDFVPNPTLNNTNLIVTSSVNQDIDVAFYNLLGEVVSSSTHSLHKGGNQINFGLSTLTAGTYTAVVTSKNEVYSKKIVVVK